MWNGRAAAIAGIKLPEDLEANADEHTDEEMKDEQPNEPKHENAQEDANNEFEDKVAPVEDVYEKEPGAEPRTPTSRGRGGRQEAADDEGEQRLVR